MSDKESGGSQSSSSTSFSTFRMSEPGSTFRSLEPSPTYSERVTAESERMFEINRNNWEAQQRADQEARDAARRNLGSQY